MKREISALLPIKIDGILCDNKCGQKFNGQCYAHFSDDYVWPMLLRYAIDRKHGIFKRSESCLNAEFKLNELLGHDQ